MSAASVLVFADPCTELQRRPRRLERIAICFAPRLLNDIPALLPSRHLLIEFLGHEVVLVGQLVSPDDAQLVELKGCGDPPLRPLLVVLLAAEDVGPGEADGHEAVAEVAPERRPELLAQAEPPVPLQNVH